MLEDLPDQRRVLDARDHPDLATAYLAGLDARGSVVRSTTQLKAGDTITAHLADGVIGATVDRTNQGRWPRLPVQVTVPPFC